MKKLLMIIGCVLAVEACAQQQIVSLNTESGKSFKIGLNLPNNYDADNIYPVAIGPADVNQGETGFFWKNFKNNDSWIIVDAAIYRSVKAAELQAIKKFLEEKFNIEGGKFHAVGFSANSSSVFKLVMSNPELFHSVTGIPAGLTANDSEVKKLKNVKAQFLVGGNDGYWLRSSQKLHKQFSDLGIDSRLEVFPNKGHVLSFLVGQPLMDRIDKLR